MKSLAIITIAFLVSVLLAFVFLAVMSLLPTPPFCRGRRGL